MKRGVAFTLALVATFAPVALPAATGAGAACAATTPHAGLVIDTGSRTLQLCVQLDASRVSGLHLIELAGDQLGLQYGFGLGGQGLCRLDGAGPAGDDCFSDYPDYWGYWKGDGSGSWTWSSSGPATSTVGDGELDGWVWGTGDTGASHDEPPSVAIDDVCVPEASPSPSPSPDPEPVSATASPTNSPTHGTSGSSSPATTPTTASTSPAAGRSPAPASTSRSPDGLIAHASQTASPSASRVESSLTALAALPGDSDSGSGNSAPGLLAALTLGALLGLGGWLRLRAGRRESAP